jgi:DNA polymerase III subunit delta'
MDSSGILGQERILKMLQAELSAGAVGHAYLFYGPTGSGKKTLALFLAAALNCDKFPLGPCSTCLPCRKIHANNHPDFYIVQPDGKNVKIDQIKKVRKETSLRPQEGRYQVFMVDLCEGLTPEAANSLLKILEEPPSQTVFILLAQNPVLLPQTVVSRCQLFSPDRLSPADLTLLLEGMPEVDAKQKALAVQLAEGLPGRALQALSSDRQGTLSEAEALLQNWPPDNTITASAGDLADNKDFAGFLETLITLMRDQLIFSSGNDMELLYFPSRSATLATLAEKWPTWRARGALAAMLSLQDTLKTPINARLAIEQALRRVKEV